MPQTPQPAVSRTDPAYQQANTSSRTPRALQPEILGHNFTHQYASTSPRKPWALAPPTSRQTPALEALGPIARDSRTGSACQ
uniref:Period circadian protein 3-like n=1 Tax=Lipotes vexillifer TaxID=118797 RepID=Q1G148_LIPVE|nr:period circadian protein 3-like [Lipotes vexillifer]